MSEIIESDIVKPSLNKYSVDVAGVPLKIKSSLGPAEVETVCALVSEQMQEYLKNTKSASIQSAAILTALNLAEELLSTKQQGLRQLDELNSKMRSLSKKLNRYVDQAPE